MDDIRPLRAIAKNKQIIDSKITLFSPPIAYQAAYQQPTGSRFGADAMFNGDNRGRGAQFTYLVSPVIASKEEKNEDDDDKANDSDADDDKNEIKWDSISLKIYNGDKLIRTLKRKVPEDKGLHKWTWYMDEKGGDRPSRTVRKSSRESGGVDVKPGNYKAILEYGDQTSETMITVASDPRLEVSTKNTDAVYAALKEIENIRQIAADATKQLAENKKLAEKYKTELTDLDKEKYKDEIKASKDIIKQIDELLDIYIGKQDKRQGITKTLDVSVNNRIGTASWYIATRQNGLTSTETTLLQHAKEDLKLALEKTNTFFNTNFKPYYQSIKINMTKGIDEIKTFSLD